MPKLFKPEDFPRGGARMRLDNFTKDWSATTGEGGLADYYLVEGVSMDWIEGGERIFDSENFGKIKDRTGDNVGLIYGAGDKNDVGFWNRGVILRLNTDRRGKWARYGGRKYKCMMVDDETARAFGMDPKLAICR